MKLQENISLAPYTTFKSGGPARWFVEAVSEQELLAALRFARERRIPVFVLGGGSNLLVSDAGFNGLVVRIALKGVAEEEHGLFSVAAGEDWDGFVRRAVAENCAGIESLAGIPGTVGGTPVQNVGAYGQEVAETIQSVRVFDLWSSEFVDLPREECEFSYRASIFNKRLKGRYIVTRVAYRLVPEGLPRLAYADLKTHFAGHQNAPTLLDVYDAVREIRNRKGMLIVEGEMDCRSAGSFFKNPVVPADMVGRIAAQAAVTEADVPRYPARDGLVKLPAAWLLEKSGFTKGFVQGKAGISSRHTLALINRGGASAADVMALRDSIVAEVERRFGIRLEPEPVVVG